MDPDGNDRQDQQDTPDRMQFQTGLQKTSVIQGHRVHTEHEGDPRATCPAISVHHIKARFEALVHLGALVNLGDPCKPLLKK